MKYRILAGLVMAIVIVVAYVIFNSNRNTGEDAPEQPTEQAQ